MSYYVSVLLPVALDKTLTYKSEGYIEQYTLITTTFRNKEIVGIVITNNLAPPVDIPIAKIKSVKEVHKHSIKKELLEFIYWVASYNLIPIGNVCKMLLNAASAKVDPLKHSEQCTHNLPKLNKYQAQAVGFIHKSMPKPCVLEGVTGSGKTEVYLSIIKEVLERGGQVLILLPEIVLTTQLLGRFKERLGDIPYQWHSGLTPKKRKQLWSGTLQGEIKLIVGARSALFLPFSNLQLIVVDEEHDISFKQESNNIYNARDMAIVRAKLEKIPIILSSATPSIETWHNIKQGKFCHFHIPKRYGTSTLPHIGIIDMNLHKRTSTQSISQELHERITKTLEEKKQSLLFLNRRGYAPLTICSNCGHKIECPDCKTWLIDHKKRDILQCHYCGYHTSRQAQCANCISSDKMIQIGVGVERLEEEVKERFTQAKIAILTSDTIQNTKQAAHIIDEITSGKVDIIIGTQMIVKGLHFPKLRLVGIIDADLEMIGGDIRSMERTYQILHQVAGRAGRESAKGEVLIQTLSPRNQVFQYLTSDNPRDYINYELDIRRISNSPPFSRLAIIHASSLKEEYAGSYLRSLVRCMPTHPDISVIGPAPSPILMIKKRYRYRIMVRTAKAIDIQKFLKIWLARLKTPGRVRVKIDIDPYSFS